MATPWSGETLKYFRPKVRLIASNLKIDLKGARTWSDTYLQQCHTFYNHL